LKSEILKQTVAGSIILSHDIHKTTVDAMPETLDGLLAKGFKFVTVSELLAMDRPATHETEEYPHGIPGAEDGDDGISEGPRCPPAPPAPATPAPAAKH